MSKGNWHKDEVNIIKKYSTGQIYEDNELDLASAIVQEACKEYRSAYQIQDRSKMTSLEVWFYSPAFDVLVRGKIHPDSLLRGIRQQVDAKVNKLYQHQKATYKNKKEKL